jgi:hypothetical protein
LVKLVWRLFKKLKIELPYDPEIPLLGIHLKDCKSYRHLNTGIYCSTVHNIQAMEIIKIKRTELIASL